MSMLDDRSPLILRLGTAITALLLCASIARAQPPAESSPHAAASGSHGGSELLMRRDLVGLPGKEVVVSTIEVPPGGSPPPHRHYSQDLTTRRRQGTK